MTGFMVRDESAGHRYFIVAISNKAEAESAAKSKFDLPGPLESVPLPEGVFQYLHMKQNELQEWKAVQES